MPVRQPATQAPGHRRLILLLGSPRSGTSWLAKILDTYPGVWYAHEPLKNPVFEPLKGLLDRLTKTGLTPEEQQALRGALAGAHYAWMRPPFFRKQFQTAPASALAAAWGLVKMSRRGYALFSRLFSPPADRPYDLLVKEVGWREYLPQLITSLRADHMVFIFRHPCAVVHSRLEGVRLGMMSRYRQGWLECNEKPCKDFGFAPDQVRAMEDYEFFALRWLVLSQEYYELARTSKAATTVVYEDLCRDPLGVARSVFASLGWPMLPATERFIRRSTSPGLRARLSTTLRGKLSYYGLYKDPVETAQSWQKRLPAEQQRRILAIARPFSAMDWWGEGPVRNRPSRGPDGPPGAVEEARSPLSMLRT